MPTAFVAGITGQDGQCLTESHHVFGMVKGQNSPRVEELQHELPYFELEIHASASSS